MRSGTGAGPLTVSSVNIISSVLPPAGICRVVLASQTGRPGLASTTSIDHVLFVGSCSMKIVWAMDVVWLVYQLPSLSRIAAVIVTANNGGSIESMLHAG